MAAPCAGIGSVLRPGVGAATVMSITGIAALIDARVGKGPAALFAVILSGLQWDLTAICSEPPPADPILTFSDMVNLANFEDVAVSAPSVARLRDWFLHWYWFVVCQCADGSSPAADAPSIPPDVVQPNPGMPAAPQGQGCWQANGNVVFHNNGQDLFWQPNLLPAGTPMALWNGAQKPVTLGTPLPASIRYASVLHAGAAGSITQQGATIIYYDLNSVAIGGSHIGPIVGLEVQSSISVAVPANAIYATVGGTPGSGSFIDGQQLSGAVTIFCQGQNPTTPATPCCPPDLTLDLRLTQILGLVTMLQRQLAPFGYVTRATHQTLSGNGEVTVQGLLGVKVLPTTIPPGIGVDVGDPDVLWLDSWINWGNADGWREREFLRASPHVSLPNLAGQFTKIGYSLRPGVVVDVVELVREP